MNDKEIEIKKKIDELKKGNKEDVAKEFVQSINTQQQYNQTTMNLNDAKIKAREADAAQERQAGWENIKKTAKEWYMGKTAGYDTWQSAMSEVLAMDKEALFLMKDWSLFNKITQYLPNRTPTPLTSLKIEMMFDANNTLQFKKAERNDGKPFLPAQLDALEATACYWLLSKGYSIVDDPSKKGIAFEKMDAQGRMQPLTQSEYETLNAPEELSKFANQLQEIQAAQLEQEKQYTFRP